MAENLNRTLQRGLAMLELLSENPGGLELHEIADQLALPKSSAFNLLKTLLDAKYVRQVEGRYSLSLRLFEVGASAVNQVDTTALLRRYMQDIRQQCNETMHLGIKSGMEVLYIDKLESTHSIRMSSRIGARMPLYATAMGKAFLAAYTDAEVTAMYQDVPLAPITPHTITTLPALLAQLAEIRQTGLAIERSENNENVSCIGVCIRNRDMQPAYALSISAPAFRITEADFTAYGKLLLAAQAKIERVLRAL